MSKNQVNAIIYCRQSSGKEEDSESIILQEEVCRKYAKSHGMKVLAVFADANTPGRLYPTGAEELMEQDDALKAWLRTHSTDKRYRPGLGEVLAMASSAQVLLVMDTTRLYRPVQNSYLQSYVNRKLINAGIELVSIKEGRIDFSNFSDSLVSSIQQQVNDNQIALGREKSKMAMAKIQDSGYYSTMPRMYGIRYVGGKDRSIELIPEQVEVIRFVYDRILKRTQYTDLLRELNDKYRDRINGKCFYDSSWRHIISNPFYCGYMYDTHGALIPARQMEGKAFITYEDWKRANEIVNTPRSVPRQRKNMLHPFSGLMYCGHCGSRMSVTEDGGKICYSCLQGVNARHEAECGKSRVNINLVRQSEEFTGLRKAIAPLLLLALYKELELKSGSGRLLAKIEEKTIEIENADRKLNELSELFAGGEIKCYAAYEAAYAKGHEARTRLNNELVRMQHELEEFGCTERKAKEYLELVDKVMNDKLEPYEFKDLLLRSVKKIVCFEDRLDIETIYGNFTMMRYMKAKYRNFPRFTYKVMPKSGKNKITNLRECLIKVTYVYEDDKNEELVVDLSVMKIYKK